MMTTDAIAVPQGEMRSRSANAYGWVMVFVAAVAMVATLPGRTHGLGMITERLLNDPGLSLTRTGYGEINFWATLLGALFCLGIGQCVDRLGIRISLGVVMLALGGSVLGMTGTTSIPLFFLLIMFSRGFGQSALSVVSITIVGKWFDRNTSFPMAVYAILVAGGFIATALIGRDFADIDWRAFWSAIGWSVIGGAILLTLVARDCRPSAHVAAGGEAGDENCFRDYTLWEAMRTPMFWVCSLSISLYGMIISGISLFNESILIDQGFAKEVYYESLAWGAGIGVFAKLGTGLSGIYCSINRLLSFALLLLAVSLYWLSRLENYQDVIRYVMVNATAGGMLAVLFFSVWPELYGRKHLGQIQGTAQMMTVLASAAGPMLFAQTRQATGSYAPLLGGLALCTVVTAGVAWVTPIPSNLSLAAGDR